MQPGMGIAIAVAIDLTLAMYLERKCAPTVIAFDLTTDE